MYSNNIEIGANMFNLVYKEQSTKRWIITFSDNYGELHQGRGDNRPEWFSTRRETLNFLEKNFSEEELLVVELVSDHQEHMFTEELTDHMVSLVCIGLIGLTTGTI